MLLYFAYGSNMHPARLRSRIGPCEAVEAGRLTGHRLAFHKRGRDGSGKCDAHRTRVPGHVVHGVIYRIGRAQKLILDRVEGVGRGYESVTTTVHGDGGEREAVLYRAQPAHIEPAARPFAWYHALVLAGARYHGLPADYIEHIAAVEAMDDRDAARHARHMQLLEGLEIPDPG